MARPKNKSRFHAGSGNVFADLKLPNAGEKHTEARLALAINQIIASQKLPQDAAARRLKVNQPKISALANYRLEGISVERLMRFLNALDRDIEIVIRRRRGSRRGGRILVTAG